VLFCWSQGLFPLTVAAQYAVLPSLGGILVYAMFRTDYNLRLRDPSLTMFQMAISIPPAL
jgi:hypothetical protein